MNPSKIPYKESNLDSLEEGCIDDGSHTQGFRPCGRTQGIKFICDLNACGFVFSKKIDLLLVF